MKQTLFALFLLMSMSSCMRIAYKIQGVHPPKLESVKSIYSFCKKHDIDTIQTRIMGWGNFLENIQKNNSKDLLFDQNGVLVSYSVSFDNSSCSQNIVTIISSIVPKSFLPRDSSITLQKESLKWRFLNDTSKVVEINPEGEDYTIVTYWNMYAGKPNHIKRFEKLKAAKATNSNIKFRHIYVNQDFRDDMDLELKSKFGTKKKK